MEVFVSLIIIVFGILQIILFFKLWGMTNDVKKITEKLCDTLHDNYNEDNNIESKNEEYDSRLDTVKPGDKVKLILDGRELIVDSISNGKFFCKTGTFSGYKYFGKNEVEYIEKG